MVRRRSTVRFGNGAPVHRQDSKKSKSLPRPWWGLTVSGGAIAGQPEPLRRGRGRRVSGDDLARSVRSRNCRCPREQAAGQALASNGTVRYRRCVDASAWTGYLPKDRDRVGTRSPPTRAVRMPAADAIVSSRSAVLPTQASPGTTSAPLRRQQLASAARSVRRSSSITGPACNHRRGCALPRASTLPVPPDGARSRAAGTGRYRLSGGCQVAGHD